MYQGDTAKKQKKTGSKCRMDLKNWPSDAKYLEESYFDVKKSLAPPKSAENGGYFLFSENVFCKKFFGAKKIDFCKLSETRFAKVWARSDRSSGGKRKISVCSSERSSRSKIIKIYLYQNLLWDRITAVVSGQPQAPGQLINMASMGNSAAVVSGQPQTPGWPISLTAGSKS